MRRSFQTHFALIGGRIGDEYHTANRDEKNDDARVGPLGGEAPESTDESALAQAPDGLQRVGSKFAWLNGRQRSIQARTDEGAGNDGSTWKTNDDSA